MLNLNEKTPNFILKDRFGKNHSLDTIKSNYVIIYFYPKDNTPGCTLEAVMLNQRLKEFKNLNTEIIGISGGDEKSKDKFCSRNNLKLILLSDTDFSTSKSYGVYNKKSFMGKSYYGITRTTFILDKKRKLIKIFENVKPLTHATELIKYLKENGG